MLVFLEKQKKKKKKKKKKPKKSKLSKQNIKTIISCYFSSLSSLAFSLKPFNASRSFCRFSHVLVLLIPSDRTRRGFLPSFQTRPDFTIPRSLGCCSPSIGVDETSFDIITVCVILRKLVSRYDWE